MLVELNLPAILLTNAHKENRSEGSLMCSLLSSPTHKHLVKKRRTETDKGFLTFCKSHFIDAVKQN